MKILLNDFSGFSYPLDLSRQLARWGHGVTHVYCDSLVTTPGGNLKRRLDDPDSLEIKPLVLSEPLAKYRFFKRRRQAILYGKLLAREIEQHEPDVVISANAPLDTQQIIMRKCQQLNIPFVFWLQDLTGIAARRILPKRIPLLGHAIGEYYLRMERGQLRRSAAVVSLTSDFVPILTGWGIPAERHTVIENWAPISEIPIGDKSNEWSSAEGLENTFNFIYAGTMGLKHNPELIVELARTFSDVEEVRIVVLSQGLGADFLTEKKVKEGLDNLIVKDFVHFSKMHNVMAAADVLVVVLEEDASVFSVPSKTLAYLCSRRAILASMPLENLAAKILLRNQAGLVAAPKDVEKFTLSARKLYEDQYLRPRLAAAGRDYAEETFQISRIAKSFEQVLQRALSVPLR